MIFIDGSQGEGGGQVLRTSLALSLLTGTPVAIENIRAGRPKPGLARQHLTCVQAAAAVGAAEASGADLGSRSLRFIPGKIRPGEYRFSVGTAGSAILVLQTVLPPLMVAGGPSRLTVTGGTHNPKAPPFEFFARAFLPLLVGMGANCRAELKRPGFYPAGGGEIVIEIEPAAALKPLELAERGAMRAIRATAIAQGLPAHVVERELKIVGRGLRIPGENLIPVLLSGESGVGNALSVEIECERVTEVVTALGRKGLPAERVAREAVRAAEEYLEAGCPIGEFLADQLIIPLAMSGGTFRTAALTPHALTNIDVVRRFLPADIRVEADAGGVMVSAARARA